MKDLFLPFELACKAKEQGFNEPCFGKWNRVNKRFYPRKNLSELNKNSEFSVNTIAAPLYQQIVDFIRERGIVISIYNNAGGFLWNMAKSEGGTDMGWSEYTGSNDSGVWDTFYEALLAAIGTAFELINK